MTAIEAETAEQHPWLEVHNYAATTVRCRIRYLAYFVEFCHNCGIDTSAAVTFELFSPISGISSSIASAPVSRSPPPPRLSGSFRSRTSSPGFGGQVGSSVNPAGLAHAQARPPTARGNAQYRRDEPALGCAGYREATRPPRSCRPRGLLLLLMTTSGAHRAQDEGRRLRSRHRFRPQWQGRQGPLLPDRGTCALLAPLYLELPAPA